jgi:drug/metabolite transporter (DMT)-like permease
VNQSGASASVTRARVLGIPLVALIGGAVTIGFAPILVRLSQVGPNATAFWRLLFALPALWLWLTLDRQSTTSTRRPSSRADYLRLVGAGLFFVGDLGFWHWALGYTTVANATLLVNFAPVFVTLGSWWLFRQRVRPLFLLGMTTALVGATMLIGTSFRLSLDYFWGDFLAIVAAIFYAGYLLSVKYLRREFSAATVMTWAGSVACLVFLPITLLTGESWLPFSLQGWLVLVALGWFIHVGGQGLIAYALAHLPAPFSSVTLLVQPVTAALFAWILLSEVIGFWQALGGSIVLAGIFMARQGSRA